MSQVSDRDVEAIKEWLAKESHLPHFDDRIIKKFLFSCHNSLESTKKCIDEFCTRRARMPGIFTNRDTTSKKLQQVFSLTAVTTYIDANTEILMHMIKEVPSDFDFYTFVRTFTTQLDNWILLERDVLPENHESMPLRLKEVHFINCPSYYEYIFNAIKPAFPEWICKLMHFHPDHTGLYKFVNKESLPKEYGGESESIEEQNAFWIKDLASKRKIFIYDNLWKADLSLKVKNDRADNSMNGSFKTLEID